MRVCRHGIEEDDNQLSTKFLRQETIMNESNVQHKMTGFGNFSPFMDAMKTRVECMFINGKFSWLSPVSSCFVQGLDSKKTARVDVQELLPALFCVLQLECTGPT